MPNKRAKGKKRAVHPEASTSVTGPTPTNFQPGGPSNASDSSRQGGPSNASGSSFQQAGPSNASVSSPPPRQLNALHQSRQSESGVSRTIELTMVNRHRRNMLSQAQTDPPAQPNPNVSTTVSVDDPNYIGPDTSFLQMDDPHAPPPPFQALEPNRQRPFNRTDLQRFNFLLHYFSNGPTSPAGCAELANYLRQLLRSPITMNQLLHMQQRRDNENRSIVHQQHWGFMDLAAQVRLWRIELEEAQTAQTAQEERGEAAVQGEAEGAMPEGEGVGEKDDGGAEEEKHDGEDVGEKDHDEGVVEKRDGEGVGVIDTGEAEEEKHDGERIEEHIEGDDAGAKNEGEGGGEKGGLKDAGEKNESDAVGEMTKDGDDGPKSEIEDGGAKERGEDDGEKTEGKDDEEKTEVKAAGETEGECGEEASGSDGGVKVKLPGSE